MSAAVVSAAHSFPHYKLSAVACSVIFTQMASGTGWGAAKGEWGYK